MVASKLSCQVSIQSKPTESHVGSNAPQSEYLSRFGITRNNNAPSQVLLSLFAVCLFMSMCVVALSRITCERS